MLPGIVVSSSTRADKQTDLDLRRRVLAANKLCQQWEELLRANTATSRRSRRDIQTYLSDEQCPAYRQVHAERLIREGVERVEGGHHQRRQCPELLPVARHLQRHACGGGFASVNKT